VVVVMMMMMMTMMTMIKMIVIKLSVKFTSTSRLRGLLSNVHSSHYNDRHSKRDPLKYRSIVQQMSGRVLNLTTNNVSRVTVYR
jgi:hypothetical protein